MKDIKGEWMMGSEGGERWKVKLKWVRSERIHPSSRRPHPQ